MKCYSKCNALSFLGYDDNDDKHDGNHCVTRDTQWENASGRDTPWQEAPWGRKPRDVVSGRSLLLLASQVGR